MRRVILTTREFNDFWEIEREDIHEGTPLWSALASWDYCSKLYQKKIDARDKRILELEQKLKQIAVFSK